MLKKFIAICLVAVFLSACGEQASDIADFISPELDKAITEALYDRRTGYREGEFFSSAYHVLQIEEDDTEKTLYLLATYGWYNRAGGATFEMVSGIGMTYVVLRLARENGAYIVRGYNEYYKDVEEFFPAGALNDARRNGDGYYAEMTEIKENKVLEYFS